MCLGAHPCMGHEHFVVLRKVLGTVGDNGVTHLDGCAVVQDEHFTIGHGQTRHFGVVSVLVVGDSRLDAVTHLHDIDADVLPAHVGVVHVEHDVRRFGCIASSHDVSAHLQWILHSVAHQFAWLQFEFDLSLIGFRLSGLGAQLRRIRVGGNGALRRFARQLCGTWVSYRLCLWLAEGDLKWCLTIGAFDALDSLIAGIPYL